VGKNFEIIFKEFANSETFVMSRALLEDYKAKAALEERERIIKLLEELKEPDMKFYKFKTLVNIDRIIALIKGENK